MTAIGNSEFQAHTQRIERLVERVSSLADEDARTAALGLLQSMMDLHGMAAARIVELLNATEAGRSALAKLSSDPLICGMFVLYGVHPVPLEERVARAVESVGPQLRKHGGSAALIGVADSVVRVTVQGSGNGCGSSGDALKGMVEQAILEAAPEIVQVVVEGAVSSATGFVPLNLIKPATKEESNYEESAA
jgi:Fe-S cluster biogenesis protein NfuA